MTAFTLTKHAIQRALDMALDAERIRAVVLNPSIRIWEDQNGHNPGWLHKSGTGTACLAAIVDETPEGALSVRTFLPGTREAWVEDTRFVTAEGRDTRFLNTT